jgi:hypothetical protein
MVKAPTAANCHITRDRADGVRRVDVMNDYVNDGYMAPASA